MASHIDPGSQINPQTDPASATPANPDPSRAWSTLFLTLFHLSFPCSFHPAPFTPFQPHSNPLYGLIFSSRSSWVHLEQNVTIKQPLSTLLTQAREGVKFGAFNYLQLSKRLLLKWCPLLFCMGEWLLFIPTGCLSTNFTHPRFQPALTTSKPLLE